MSAAENDVMPDTTITCADDDNMDLTLLRLHHKGAALLPDPEKCLREKAAALAAIEHETQTEAFRTAGCVTVYAKSDHLGHCQCLPEV
jgi:hypothetical protein